MTYPIDPASRGWLTYDGDDTGVAVAVRFDRYTFDRPMFQWMIAGMGEVIAAGDDLGLGTNDEPCLRKALETLVTFMSAAAESYNYAERKGVDLSETENGSIFPAEAMPAIAVAADQLCCDLVHEEP